jgi:hypothetical protein
MRNTKENTATPVQVASITAVAGGPSTFALTGGGTGENVVSSYSQVVQRALVSAFLTNASVLVELVPGSNVIKRVDPFEPGRNRRGPPGGDYVVSRIGTQRNASGDEHLEVFLIKNRDPERAFNVYDPLLQQLFHAVFGADRQPPEFGELYVELDGAEIATVRLGAVQPQTPSALAPDRKRRLVGEPARKGARAATKPGP